MSAVGGEAGQYPVAGKKIAILQSNYIPWKGYFDIIAAVDEFVLYDEVQYTRHDWRNRNKIVQAGKLQWLKVPAVTNGDLKIPIKDVGIANGDWAGAHWTEIEKAYGKALGFDAYGVELQKTYDAVRVLTRLTEVNELLLRVLCKLLDIDKPIIRAETIARETANPTARLVEICTARGASTYVSGPAAKDYIEQDRFDAAGITLRYVDYAGYPVYDQVAAEFTHGVSVIDLLMRCGPEARSHLKAVQRPDGLLATA